jgi:HNH endonuclease
MAITDKTRKLLWGRSGRSCAFCKCDLFIDATAESEESVVGDECHIVSGQVEGPRYDPTFRADLIDHVSNLLLLCKVHHKMVDDQYETYTTEVLRKIKADHEHWVRLAMVAAAQRHVDENQRTADLASGRTFVSHMAFFAAKAPKVPNPILDFSLPLHGRADQLRALQSFLESESESIAFLSGRGGLGKSKLLHDWSASLDGWDVIFLKEAPLWHPNSAREVPQGKVVIVVDDAHRASTLSSVIELYGELRSLQTIMRPIATLRKEFAA